MKIAVFWRKNRNVEFQKKVSTIEVYDDALEEAKQLKKGLQDAGFDVVLLEWRANPEEMHSLIMKEKIDLVFNASSYEEAIFLETYKIPFTGSSSKVIATDKVARKIIVSYFGIDTPKFTVAKSKNAIPLIDLTYPLFIKPLNGRGSAGIDETNIIERYDQIPDVVGKITEKIGQPALIEEFIEGRELTVGIIGNEDPIILPILEIKYTYGRTNTFEHKMLDREIIICPMPLPAELENKIKAIALKAYKVLDIADYGRIDLILDKNNIPYFLELNTFAGLTLPDTENIKTAHIGYMGYMAIKKGYDRATFLRNIVNATIKRYGLK